MKTTFALLVQVLVFCYYANAQQKLTENTLLATKIKTLAGDTVTAYVLNISDSLITVYDPAQPQKGFFKISAEEIERMLLLKKGSFWGGFGITSLVGETVLLASALGASNAAYFLGPGFFIFIGTAVLVLPASALVGFINATPKLLIDHTVNGDPEAFRLATRKARKFSYDEIVNVMISEKGQEKLQKIEFLNGEKLPKSSTNYTPGFYLHPLRAGISYSFVQGQFEKALDGDLMVNRDYSGYNWTSIWTFGVGYSPDPNWEMGYYFQTASSAILSFYDEMADERVDLSYYTSQLIHQVNFLYRIKPYVNGSGNFLQFAIGGGLALQDLILDGELYAYEENNYDEDFFSSKHLVPGLNGHTRLDFFLSRNISLNMSASVNIFKPVSTKPLRLQSTTPYEVDRVKFSPNTFDLGAGLSFQF